MIEEAAAQELPLSSNTICKRMEKTSDDINDQLVAKKCMEMTSGYSYMKQQPVPAIKLLA